MRTKRKKHPLLLTAVLLLLALSLLLCDSAYRLVTDEYTLSFENLPSGFDGFRIVQLSDLHGAVYGKDNARLVRAVRAAKPDLIALTGDFIDTADDLASFSDLARSLTAIAPVYFVSGNHDWNSGSIKALAEILRRAGVRYLQNEAVTLERSGGSILLAGVEDPNGPADMIKPDRLMERLRAEQPDSFILLLGHRNYWAERYPALPVDLILCGHGHGGVVRLPLVGGLLGTGGEFLPEYSDGVFSSGQYRMLVSRGLGGRFPLIRFLNNPEIVVLTLKSA
jgi:predicted MPP superfamily phosphohydrolase